jgi:hypothetical protein
MSGQVGSLNLVELERTALLPLRVLVRWDLFAHWKGLVPWSRADVGD